MIFTAGEDVGSGMVVRKPILTVISTVGEEPGTLFTASVGRASWGLTTWRSASDVTGRCGWVGR